MTSTIKVNNIQNQCGANIINESSNTITLGASGDNIVLASGATQAGFGREGSVNWQTGSIKTSTFTAASGEGYFCNTAGGAFTVNLPAGSAGAIVSVADYTRTFQTNNLTVSPNGSEKIGGIVGSAFLSVEGQSATFVYVDGTEGWINVQNAEDTAIGVPPFIQATGGTITTSGNFKIHTFTGPGTFEVTKIATTSPAPIYNIVSYAIVGGGGSGAGYYAGGGAGGFREGKNAPVDSYTASPLNAPAGIPVSVTSYPITVGAGGNAPPVDGAVNGGSGSPTSGLSITSAGGGFGGGVPCGPAGGSGGSGGGEGYANAAGAGAGNTPPVSPPQGNNGGIGAPGGGGGGGGGGATAVGANAPPANNAGAGGAGATTNIIGSPTAYAGGGGGGAVTSGGAGGAGGGGTGSPGNGNSSPARTGAANTGGGGGARSGSGGSGVVIIRYKFQ